MRLETVADSAHYADFKKIGFICYQNLTVQINNVFDYLFCLQVKLYWRIQSMNLSAGNSYDHSVGDTSSKN